MKQETLKKGRCLLYMAAAVTIITGCISIFYPDIYIHFVDPDYIAESVGQDIVSVLTAVFLIIMTALPKRNGIGPALTTLGLLVYLVYAYAIYAFGSVYNPLFFNYIAIISLSVFAGFMKVREIVDVYTRNGGDAAECDRIRGLSAALFLILTVLILAFVWISSIAEHIASKTTARETVIYVLDLSMILPLFALTAIRILSKKLSGQFLSVVCMVNALVLGLSIVSGQLVKWISGMMPDFFLAGFFGLFTVAAMIITLVMKPRFEPKRLQ